jgi:hypothetical protein
VSDIGSTLRSVLLADGAISALVSTRIYPDARPQDCELPAIEYSIVSSVDHQDLSGPTGTETARIQFDIYALTRLDANALADLAKKLLAGLQQESSYGVWIEGATIAGGIRYGSVDPSDGSDEKTRMTSFDVQVTWQNA